VLILFLFSASNSSLQEKTSHHCRSSSDLFEVAEEHYSIPKLGWTIQHSEAELYAFDLWIILFSTWWSTIIPLSTAPPGEFLTRATTGSDDGYWERWQRLAVFLFVFNTSNL